MKAIAFSRYRSLDSVELRNVPTPSFSDDQLLVRVAASSINSWDWEFLMGTSFLNRLMFGLVKPRRGNQILGADIAGTVEAVGSRVTRFEPGDEVFGDLWSNWGGFAEFAVADEGALELKPPSTTFEQAAVVPQAGVLALQGLAAGGPVRPGQKVLINGAGGGVGTFAIQLAKAAGAEITGVDAAHKLDIIRSAGADHSIDYAEQDFTQTGDHWDLIVDCQGHRSMSDIKRALSSGGTYAMVGGTRILALLIESPLSRLTGETRKLRLVAEGPNKGLAQLGSLLESGDLTPIIDSTFRLDEVPEALRHFGEGRHRGKIAISIGP